MYKIKTLTDFRNVCLKMVQSNHVDANLSRIVLKHLQTICLLKMFQTIKANSHCASSWVKLERQEGSDQPLVTFFTRYGSVPCSYDNIMPVAHDLDYWLSAIHSVVPNALAGSFEYLMEQVNVHVEHYVALAHREYYAHKAKQYQQKIFDTDAEIFALEQKMEGF